MKVINNNIYIYLYQDGTYDENNQSIKLEEYKITINNNQLIRTKTGNAISGTVGQCS